ncbi:hypothetical protein [Winogradskyella sp.]|uniref:hypothetical protein n=1 Tax=Winogradskyella sp. TaxID=1883156 RepID=UPI0025E2DB0B|nr:hypothetical protein [Winogradskyella sp.]
MICGAVVSITVIVCTAVDGLPQLSVAVQVRVITNSPSQAPGVVTSEDVISIVVLHASVAVATPVAVVDVSSEHSTVTSAGTVSSGAVVSTTVIVCVSDTELPVQSVAVQVRVITDSP